MSKLTFGILEPLVRSFAVFRAFGKVPCSILLCFTYVHMYRTQTQMESYPKFVREIKDTMMLVIDTKLKQFPFSYLVVASSLQTLYLIVNYVKYKPFSQLVVGTACSIRPARIISLVRQLRLCFIGVHLQGSLRYSIGSTLEKIRCKIREFVPNSSFST